MKIESFARRLPAAGLLVATLALAVTPGLTLASAQNNDSSVKKRGSDSAAANTGASQYDLEITDGFCFRKGVGKVPATLENVVELLRERHEGANIVLAPGLPRITIGNLKLRAVNLDQELEALFVASGYKFKWGRNYGSTTVDPMGNPVAPSVDPATGLPVPREFTTVLYTLTEVPKPPESRPRAEVYNLTGYINSLGQEDADRQKLVDKSLDEIMKIVAATSESVSPGQAARINFKFHPGANLLVVIGGPEDLEVARQVVTALQPQSTPPGAGTAFAPGYGAGATITSSPFGIATQSKERRALIAKLGSIRLDTVVFDGLPLAEIVRELSDETKKRDPEKLGINFLINPNPPAAPPAASPGAPPQIDPTSGLPVAPAAVAEFNDINAVIVRISPPLTHVRLVDLLDAIVRVADHPIKYSVTDYAVVFSNRNPDEPMKEPPGMAMP